MKSIQGLVMGAVVAIAVATWSIPATAADPPRTKPMIRPTKPLLPVVQPQPASGTAASQGTITHRADLATDRPLTGGALKSFRFGFNNGDHKLRTLQLLQVDGRASVAFADQNSDDPFSFNGEWWLANYTLATVSAVGGGEFDINLPQAPFGQVPLLAGFSFERRKASDANVRSIGVRLTPDRKRVRVTLIDDQGVDLRGFEKTIAAGFAMTLDPLGVASIIAPGVSAVENAQVIMAAKNAEFPEYDARHQRNFVATVQIVWVPSGAVRGHRSVSGGARSIESGAPPGANDKVALEGFHFYFANSDHHLLGLGVNLKPDRTSESILFQDNNTDDPIQWSVDYATLL